MTDRLKGVIVTFTRDIREDDAEATIAALRQIRGVADVTPMVSEHVDTMARNRIKSELHKRIREFVDMAFQMPDEDP